MKPSVAIEFAVSKTTPMVESGNFIVADLGKFSQECRETVLQNLNERGVLFGEYGSQLRSCIKLNNVSHTMSNFTLDGDHLRCDVKIKETPNGKLAKEFTKSCELNFAMRSMVDIDGNHKVITFDLVP